MQRILIAAGGTGGHIFPAIAVAEYLKEQGYGIHWIGSTRGLEKRIVAPYFPITYISIDALRGKGLLGYIALPLKLMRSLFQVWRVMRKVRPSAVLTMGSFVSAPTGVVSWLLRIPLIVHEQNAVSGMTNRFLVRLASKVLQAFPNTFSPRVGAITVGNPLRSSFVEQCVLQRPKSCHEGSLKLLVLGGSQGAHGINEVVSRWAEQYADQQSVQVWHQVGERQFEEFVSRYGQSKCNVKVDAFIAHIIKAYLWADIVVCRAGAMTVAEICALMKPAVFVPFPAAVDDHQYRNVEALSHHGAAVLVRQEKFTVTYLHQLIEEINDQPARLLEMRKALQAFAKLKATEDVANVLLDCCQKRKGALSDAK